MRTVLVVDDVPDAREVVARLLKLGGLQAVTAEDGYDALEALHEQTPDLVLLDLTMPRMDGVAVLKTLRRPALEGPAGHPVHRRLRGPPRRRGGPARRSGLHPQRGRRRGRVARTNRPPSAASIGGSLKGFPAARRDRSGGASRLPSARSNLLPSGDYRPAKHVKCGGWVAQVTRSRFRYPMCADAPRASFGRAAAVRERSRDTVVHQDAHAPTH